jgi:hypothetical protein
MLVHNHHTDCPTTPQSLCLVEAARVSLENPSVSDGIGNRSIVSLLHLARCADGDGEAL